MHLVTTKKLLTLPQGTLFSAFDPDVFRELRIFHAPMPGGTDYTYQTFGCPGFKRVTFEHVLKNLKAGMNEPTCGEIHRDGTFDDHQLYAVWDLEDMIDLHQRLGDAIERVREAG